LAGCGAGTGGSDVGAADSVTVAGDIPIAYVKRPIDPSDTDSAAGNPTDSIIERVGGDLYVRLLSSPSAPEYNITRAYTNGQGDVSDPEISYDGTKMLFSMKGPQDATWDIWEADWSNYLAGGNNVVLRRLTDDNGKPTNDPNITWGDDVDPAYLLDGRIVFSSNRQEKTWSKLGYKYLDEYEREPTIVLHTMNADGTNIEQISFNMSHDRNPTVLSDGTIMFSRWDHVGDRNQFTIFTVDTDGKKLFVKYGAHSGVTSFLHPREMADGRLMSDAMPLSRTNEGGALMIIDADNFSESNQRAPGVSASASGQTQPTFKTIDPGARTSPNGRYTTPYPLWDGTNRALVTFTPGGRTEIVQENSLITGLPTNVTREKAPAYGVYMLDLSDGTLRSVVLPKVNPSGDPVEMVTDPMPLVARSGFQRSAKNLGGVDSASDSALAAADKGRLRVRSVYDTDSENRMSNAVLTDYEQTVIGIPMIPNTRYLCANSAGSPVRYPNCDTRSQVADLDSIKNPAVVTADRRTARFARVTKAVPLPGGISREAIGETEFEMQQILGYAEIEPDGSVGFEVPADTPVGISVLDSYGRAFQTHTSWIQVRPGETITCFGCHSPRRGSTHALNNVPPYQGPAGVNPNTRLLDSLSNVITAGDDPANYGKTMFDIRHEAYTGGLITADPMSLKEHISFEDVWTTLGYVKGESKSITYAGSSFTAYDANHAAAPTQTFTGLTSTAPTRNSDGAVAINYPEHIQPIWDAKCVSCHGAGSTLDLSSNPGGTGRYTSYESLLIGDPVIDPVTGLPQLREDNGEIEVVRAPALVDTPGLARSTTLIGRIFSHGMKPDAEVAADAHNSYLNPSERRLVAEWIDVGAQYYNDPCRTRDASGRCTAYRAVTGLSESEFTSTIQPLLLTQCAGCHVAVGRTVNDPPFQAKRLVLTGSEGDFNVTASMVNNVCSPASSYLLTYPTSTLGGTPNHPHIFDAEAANASYSAIFNWIDAARAANGC
jgi:hypothetical protein